MSVSRYVRAAEKAVSAVGGHPWSHWGFRKMIELLVVLALFSVLIWLSVRLQGPFSMGGSAAVFVLGVACLVAFLRFYFIRARSAAWFYAAVLIASLWYPFAYTAIGSACVNGPGLNSPRFYVDFFFALRIEAVHRPLLMLLAASIVGGALGFIVNRFFRRGSREQPV